MPLNTEEYMNVYMKEYYQRRVKININNIPLKDLIKLIQQLRAKIDD